MSDTETPQKRKGCFFYGCVTCLVMLAVAVVVGFLLVRSAVNYANSVILKYTETSPMALPKSDMSAEELSSLKERVGEFSKALNARTPGVAPLILTSREINALAADSQEVKNMKLNDRFFITLEGNQMKGQVSLPVEEYFKLPMIKTKGRYLNGSGAFSAVVTNSTLTVRIESLEVKGQPLPDNFMKSLQQQNFAEAVNQKPTNRAAMSRFESIEIKDGTLVIKAKPDR